MIARDLSVQKDTRRLPSAHHAAGVLKLWLVDTRRRLVVCRPQREGDKAQTVLVVVGHFGKIAGIGRVANGTADRARKLADDAEVFMAATESRGRAFGFTLQR